MQQWFTSGPMQRLHCDLTGPHVKSKRGYTYLLTVLDHFTKYLICAPLRDKSALSVARALVEKVYLVYGTVEIQISDQGREFENEVLRNIATLMEFQKYRTTSYRPQTNGSVKRVHRTIQGMFAKLISANQRDWCEKIPYVSFAYNNAYHTSTTYTPAYLVFLRHPTVPLELMLEQPSPTYPANLDDFTELMAERMRQAYDVVREELQCVFGKTKRRYDSKVKNTQFGVGDLVWYYCPRVKPRLGRKWQNLTSGPMLIIRRVNQVNYAIKRSPKSRPFVVHVDRIRRFEGETPAGWITEILSTQTHKITDVSKERNDDAVVENNQVPEIQSSSMENSLILSDRITPSSSCTDTMHKTGITSVDQQSEMNGNVNSNICQPIEEMPCSSIDQEETSNTRQRNFDQTRADERTDQNHQRPRRVRSRPARFRDFVLYY